MTDYSALFKPAVPLSVCDMKFRSLQTLCSLSFFFVAIHFVVAFSTPLTANADSPNASESASRPNVLFMISDDLNCRLGCYGDPLVKTPNIDRLAARGVRFENAYCQFPLCGPSRNSMLCGLYPDATGILRNAEIFRQSIPQHISLPQAFRLSGYFAARIGKLYHYNVPNSIGTNGHDDPGSWEMEINPAGCDRMIEESDIFTLKKNSFGGTLSWYASPRPDAEHTDGMMAEEAAWVLERCAKRKDRPFFLAVGFFRPHTPYVAPKEYFEPYALDEMPLYDDVEQDRLDLPAPALMSHKREHDLLNDDLRRQAIQAYYASTTFMDAQVGKVLDALDANGLSDNTIVVFTSDHGYHLGQKGLWQKQSLFEESARVPMIIAGPGFDGEGKAAEAPVGLIDLYPTLADLCDVEAPSNLAGQSLSPILNDVSEPGRGYTISQVMRGRSIEQDAFLGYSIRTPQYRLTLWDDGERGIELYDHQADPLEKRNLAYRSDSSDIDPATQTTIDSLAKTLRNQIKEATPKEGRPMVLQTDWAPNLTNP
ncbi:Choline-sulfatase [Neorhodopirellula pilleata]|uniref:Choline-sulfatase n=2 Tax=Neorhodopirellula pilleata TaxID=2714738 RepID=A0A5C6AVN6_9BACT|nr:Choline-sulfatase [Neorhodopirellula pilleata]